VLGEWNLPIEQFSASNAELRKSIAPIIGLVLAQLRAGDIVQAGLAMDRVAATAPNDALVHFVAAFAQLTINPSRALTHLGISLALAPELPDQYWQLFQHLPHPARDINLARAAILAPAEPLILAASAQAAHNQAATIHALHLMARAVALEPGNPIFCDSLAQYLMESRRARASLALAFRAAAIDPGQTRAASNAALASNYEPEITPARSQMIARRAAGFYQSAQCELPGPDPNPNRPLRIGFVGAQAGFLPMGRFLNPLWQNLDPLDFALFSYGSAPDDHAVWQRLAGCQLIDRLSDDDLRARIRADRIDVLIDLAGHTNGGRFGVFAARAAPVQISWLGYFATTGHPNMDIILLDPYWSAPGSQEWFCEKIWDLPQGRFCYQADPRAPAVAPLPALANGHVTFGSFNKLAKLNDQVLYLWARILNAVPDSSLYLKATEFKDRAAMINIAEHFNSLGIETRRLKLQGPSGPLATLDLYRWVDIALDPYPFGGGLTTADALWMGVPVVTLAGPGPLSRQGMGLLFQAGFDDLITFDEDTYFARAVTLAADTAALAQRRAQQRGLMAQSGLCDGPGFAKTFGDMLRMIWADYLATSADAGAKTG
jgi:predicted O-linked N-acetylglucosamine transferase (SPINDLY family)